LRNDERLKELSPDKVWGKHHPDRLRNLYGQRAKWTDEEVSRIGEIIEVLVAQGDTYGLPMEKVHTS
jgi:hypothetical protein